MRRLAAGAAAVLALLLTILPFRLLSRYEVEGRSMLRAYQPGQRLLVESLSYRLRRPRVGDVVAISRPENGGRLDLKRIAAGPNSRVSIRGEEAVLGPDEWYVLGDNLSESQDSRQLGPVNGRDIVGRVWFRY